MSKPLFFSRFYFCMTLLLYPMLVRQVLDMDNCPTNLFHENFS
ncbi:hypothetical protein BVRB_8g184490 [Beta vulgaris subsp. vulgaris]|nr:hypothetical protein BVRB_8g184490 [Beta vulgaris subsp. vulgaris]